MKSVLDVIKRDTLSFITIFVQLVLIKYGMSFIGKYSYLTLLILNLICLASTNGIVPVIQPNTIYGDGGKVIPIKGHSALIWHPMRQQLRLV
jgi:hypothetical protein